MECRRIDYAENREANRQRKLRYYAENREAILDYQRRYAEKNREAVAERKRRHHQANREANNAYSRAYYAEHSAILSEKNRLYREENREALAKAKRRYYEKNRETIRQAKRRDRGLPDPLFSQPDSCECCGGEPNGHGKKHGTLHLDHCHDTGQFRGWLCSNCNTSIGMLGDNIPGVLRALFYLARSHSMDLL